MVSNDTSQMANLPQNVIIKSYPEVNYPMGEGLDDTITSIDHQMNKDNRGGKRKSPSGYPTMW